MKTKVILFLIIVITFSGCETYPFYQLYKTKSNDVKIKENGMIFENKNIKIVYNFWSNYGSGNFLITNKTDSNIFIDLSKSHLVINGIAKTYFQNRTFTELSSSKLSVGNFYSTSNFNKYSTSFGNAILINNNGIANSQTNTSSAVTTLSSGSKLTSAKGVSVSFTEEKVICIPSNSGKIIYGFNINNSIYRDCDLLRYPSRIKDLNTKKFNKNNTPLFIENVFWNKFKDKLFETNYGDYFMVKYGEFLEYFLSDKNGAETIYTNILVNYSDTPYFDTVRLHLRKIIDNNKK